MMSSVDLAKALHHETDDRFFAARFLRSVKSIYEKKGCFAGSLAISSATVAKAVSVAIAYFCIEGTVRACMESRDATGVFHIIRPLGDAGGWTALSIFSLMGLGTYLSQLIREGEYLRLKSLCRKWIESNRRSIEENPLFAELLYQKICGVLDSFSANCLFSKSLASRRLVAFSVIKKSGIDAQGKKLTLDGKLEGVFQSIKSELDEKSHAKRYFQRLYHGSCSVKKGGCGKLAFSLILGIAIPIIFLSTAVLSIVGEFGLGNQLFNEREDLPEIGHFGEWPFNAIEVVGVAFLLHLWCLINEGDFAITRKIYKSHLETLEDRPELHNRLCEIANRELEELSRGCQFAKLPLDYQFEKIEKENLSV